MTWAYKGEEDWLAIVEGGSGDEEEDEDEDDFFGKRGKRSMSSSRQPVKRRATEYEVEPKPARQPEQQPPPRKVVHHDIILAGDVIDLDSDEDESLEDMLRQAQVDYRVPLRASNALAQIRATKALLHEAQGTQTEVDVNSPAVPRREQGDLVQLTIKCSKPEIADVKVAVKSSARFKKLIKVYANMHNFDPDDVKLKSDGIPIDPDSTPSDLSMRDGDVVDAILGVLAEAELVQVDDLILRVSLGDGTYKKYRTTKTQSFQKIFDAFCKHLGVTRSQVKFQFDGEDLSENATPEDEDMETDDIIDTVIKK